MVYWPLPFLALVYLQTADSVNNPVTSCGKQRCQGLTAISEAGIQRNAVKEPKQRSILWMVHQIQSHDVSEWYSVASFTHLRFGFQ